MRYRFGPFELDGDGFRLSREGESVKVEPRVLELLLYLVERRDRLVTKDELVESVWDGRHVTDSVLSRAVSLARRALDEDADRPRFVLTVHGRGYRFANGEVELVDRAEGDVAIDPAPSGEDGEERASGRRWWAVVAIVALLTVLAVGWVRSRPASEASAGDSDLLGLPSVDRPIRVGLLPLAVDSQRPRLALVGLSIVDQLGIGLRSSERILVRDLTPFPDLLSSRNMADVAGQAGVEVVVSGGLSYTEEAGMRAHLVMHRFEGPGRATEIDLGDYRVPALTDPDAMMELQRVRQAMVDRVAETLGEHVRPDAAAPGTDDPEAYRLYLRAYDRLLKDFCDGAEPALELLEASLRRDPEFATAWVMKGVAYYNQVWACGRPGPLIEEALKAFEQARSLNPGQRIGAILETSILVESGDAEAAYEIASEIVREHPNLPDALMAEAYVLRYAGFLERSGALEDRALEVDPHAFSTNVAGNVPMAPLYLGDLDGFLERVPVGGSSYHRFYRGLAYHLSGDGDAAARELEPALRRDPEGPFSRLCAALLAIVEGRAEQARAALRSLASDRRLQDARDGEISFKIAQLMAVVGDTEGALTALERALGLGFFCPRCYAEDPLLASLAGEPRFDRVLERAAERHRALAERFRLRPELGEPTRNPD